MNTETHTRTHSQLQINTRPTQTGQPHITEGKYHKLLIHRSENTNTVMTSSQHFLGASRSAEPRNEARQMHFYRLHEYL